jgi:hypothetical protein
MDLLLKYEKAFAKACGLQTSLTKSFPNLVTDDNFKGKVP